MFFFFFLLGEIIIGRRWSTFSEKSSLLLRKNQATQKASGEVFAGGAHTVLGPV